MFQKQVETPLELDESLSSQRSKVITYAQINNVDSVKLVANQSFAILLKTTLAESGIPQLEKNLRLLFGGTASNVKIVACKTLPNNKCLLTLSVSKARTGRKYPAAEVLKHLGQPQQYQQLNQALSNNLEQLIPLQEVKAKSLDEYLAKVPDGIDPRLWEQSIRDNPDPKKLIPVPLLIHRPLGKTSSRFSDNDDSTTGSDSGSDDDLDLCECSSAETNQRVAVGSSVDTPRQSFHTFSISLLLTLIPLAIFLQAFPIHIRDSSLEKTPDPVVIDIERLEALEVRFPETLTPKNIRVIKARFAMMQSEVSVLLLLGKHWDPGCKLDPTHCVVKSIANLTQIQSNYISATDLKYIPHRLALELKISLGDKGIVVLDKLNELPGPQVMDLFQFIDKHESQRWRGLLLFAVYAGVTEPDRLDAEIVEQTLTRQWSSDVPSDTLASVISRLSASIVRIK